MKITKKEFIKAMETISPYKNIHRLIFLPEISSSIAIHCFVERIENDNTELLREYIKELNTKGYVDFTDHQAI